MSFRKLALLLIFLISAEPAMAGPPLLTHDTDTPGNNNWEINIAYTLDQRPAIATHSIPVIDVNYGIGDHIQVKYEISWLVLDEKDTGTKSGLGNSALGLKWRFYNDKQYGLALSVYPQFEFNNPTSSAQRGIVDEGTSFHLPVQIKKILGAGWINAEAGYTFNQFKDDEWLYGLSGGFEIRKNISLLAEINGIASKDFQNHTVVFNVGGQWDFHPKLGLLASIGRGFTGGADDPTLLLYLGLQIRL